MKHFVPFEIATCEMTGASQKAFPLVPDPERPFHPFRIQDPFGLRNAVVPVFRQDTKGELFGFGTAFNINQFGTFLTAHHVIDFSGESGASRPVLFLSMDAIVFGSVNVPSDCFVPVTGYQVTMMDSDDPMGALQGRQERKVAVDLAVMQASPLGPNVRSPQTLRVCKNGWLPQVGDILLAVGYPELDLSRIPAKSQKRLLTEGMYGAYGRIVEVHLNGVGDGTANPSPVIEVETDWPPGMSGGPVFNRAGDVVGIVSRSIRAQGSLPGRGYAVDLGRSYDIEPFAPSLDAPGWQLCWALFIGNENEHFSVHASEEEAVSAGDLLRQPHRIVKVANEIATKNWVLV